jgi:hypothetical protein
MERLKNYLMDLKKYFQEISPPTIRQWAHMFGIDRFEIFTKI